MAQNQYKCEECGATFNSEAEREQHNRRVHSRYTCEACGQTFGSEAELESHNRMVHPERVNTPRS
jgi:DNA-directed RNA polymerase subunit RPC12/RpoP